MFFQVPRRRLQKVADAFYSFAALDRVMPWPAKLTEQVAEALCEPSLSNPLSKLLLDQGVLSQNDPEDELFPLTRFGESRWANSRHGQSLAESTAQSVTVLDGLSWSELRRLPEGGLIYLGDQGGGFWAGRTLTDDGKIPCARCLMIRYLSGRQASPLLYRALLEGATVAFEHTLPKLDLSSPKVISWSPKGLIEVDEVLPLPDCPDCLTQSRVRTLSVNPFSPVPRLTSQEANHSARLGQLIWLCGCETVGHGGAHDDDFERGRARAVNEALERYAAHFLPPEAKGGEVVFQSSKGPCPFRLQAALLREPGSLSTGLACRDSLEEAVSDGLSEVCERDALARFWLDLQERHCSLVKLETRSVNGLELEIWQVDSYHQPTVLCIGRTETGIVTGSACGPDPRAKALTECLQNATYLASTSERGLSVPPESFEEHMRAYWTGRYRLPSLQPYQVERLTPRPLPAAVYYRDLTPPDLQRLQRHAVRVLVPGLLLLPMSHHDWPAILGKTRKPPAQPHPFG